MISFRTLNFYFISKNSNLVLVFSIVNANMLEKIKVKSTKKKSLENETSYSWTKSNWKRVPIQKANTILVFARHKFLQHLVSSKSRDKSSSFLSLSHTGGLRSPRSIYLWNDSWVQTFHSFKKSAATQNKVFLLGVKHTHVQLNLWSDEVNEPEVLRGEWVRHKPRLS